MRQEYNKLFDKITSERSDKELFEEAIRKAENMKHKSKFNKKAVIVPVAAAMTIAVGGVGVGAAFGFDYLTNLFADNEVLASEIQSNVFEDSDGHVKITVEQLLSDGSHIHAAVHYEALDERGEQWLAGEPFGAEPNSSHRILRIDCDNADRTGVTSFGSHEVKELRTATDRYFYLNSENALQSTEELSGYLCYSMVNSFNKIASIDIESTMEFKRFKIVGDERASKYLTPTYIEISPLSYALYANDDYGLVITEDLPSGGWRSYSTLSWEEYNAEVSNKTVALVLSDGERIELPKGSGGSSDDCYIWQSGEIYKITNNPSRWADYSIEFDFDELVGIEIGGVYFDLTAE
ncbi:MAG: hypothetical protein E7485_06685 [Ruminococcaceae bacterium]|nr:hypothetical protein [Oscillospiraceae bacterium]